MLESQLPLKISLFKTMCALHFLFFFLVEPCAEFTCYLPLVLCHSHFLSRVNAHQWSPRKDQALHSIGSFRPFLHGRFFLLSFLPTYHSQPSVTRLSVCRELQAVGEKILTPQRHVFSQSSQYPFGERMLEEGKSTNRVVNAGFPYTLRRSTLSELFHQACRVNEVFVDQLFFFSFFFSRVR